MGAIYDVEEAAAFPAPSEQIVRRIGVRQVSGVGLQRRDTVDSVTLADPSRSGVPRDHASELSSADGPGGDRDGRLTRRAF